MLTSIRLRSSFLRILLVPLVISVLVISVLAAGPAFSGQPKSIGLLVLRSGRFVEGRISQSAGGYVVDKPTGSMVVPFKLVDFSAVDRRDAYLTMRSRMQPPTPTRRMALARWCLTHGMYPETEFELRTILEVDPRRADARQMLGRLEAILHPNQPGRRLESPQSRSRTADGFTQTTATSLSGLKPEPAREFVSTIQPILMNKCGNARCHGSTARNRFRLTRVRAGFHSHRVFVERNLAAVLREIDRKRPSESRLLTVPRKGHGRGGRAIFFGRSGARQFQLLRTWTLTVASARSTFPASHRREVHVSGSQRPRKPVVPSPRPAGSKNLHVNSAGPPRSDPFDPKVFNRAVHGQSGKNTPGKTGS